MFWLLVVLDLGNAGGGTSGVQIFDASDLVIYNTLHDQVYFASGKSKKEQC